VSNLRRRRRGRCRRVGIRTKRIGDIVLELSQLGADFLFLRVSVPYKLQLVRTSVVEGAVDDEVSIARNAEKECAKVPFES